jgi:hypothetical protein
VVVLGRSLMENYDPKPTVDLIKARTKICRYEPGGVGTSVAAFLAGKAKLGRLTQPPPLERGETIHG